MSLLQKLNADPDNVDSIRVYTPLGIRFWDPVLDRQINRGLQVLAYPVSRPESIVYARKTWSGNYVFHKLPGLSIFAPPDESSPVDTKPYVIVIVDSSGYYSSIAITVSAPRKGLVMVGLGLSSPASPLKGLYLYANANQTAPQWYASIRGWLWNEATDAPAKYAVIKVEVSGTVFYGLADAEGYFLVLMPFPTTPQVYLSSPATSGGIDQLKQRWDISIQVLYKPGDVDYYDEVGLPDYSTLLSQTQAKIKADTALAYYTPSVISELINNQELIVKTMNESKGRLLIKEAP